MNMPSKPKHLSRPESVREGLDESVRERLKEAVRVAVTERLMSRRTAGGSQQFGAGGAGGGTAGIQGRQQQMASGGLSTLIEPLRHKIAERVRDRIGESLPRHFESVLSDCLDRTLSERLESAVRAAFAEHMALGGGFSADQIAATVCERIADPMRDEIAYRRTRNWVMSCERALDRCSPGARDTRLHAIHAGCDGW